MAPTYDPDTAPVLNLIGHGYRPAWQPADYIGPRMDCPMWLPGPDADIAYGGKLDPFKPVEGIGMGAVVYARVVYPEAKVADGGTSTGGGASGKWSPPLFPDWPTITHPCCGEPWVPHEPPIVPVPASGVMMVIAIAALALWRYWPAIRSLFAQDHPGSGWVGHDSEMPRGGYSS